MLPDGHGKLDESLSFRRPMRVIAVRSYRNCSHLLTYPICPRCGLTMDREYQRFCDRCGQALDWKGFSMALILLAQSPNRVR